MEFEDYRRHELYNITPLLQSSSKSCLYDSVLSNISHDRQASRRCTVAHIPISSKVPDLCCTRGALRVEGTLWLSCLWCPPAAIQ